MKSLKGSLVILILAASSLLCLTQCKDSPSSPATQGSAEIEALRSVLKSQSWITGGKVDPLRAWGFEFTDDSVKYWYRLGGDIGIHRMPYRIVYHPEQAFKLSIEGLTEPEIFASDNTVQHYTKDSVYFETWYLYKQ
ncbi:MAG: hypothetical protein JSS89_12125 [Bacteroidetes bacterium]|nr:hypothetical protein [Bacteroidota bacterium]